MIRTILAASIVACLAGPAMAQASLIGTNGSWSAWRSTDEAGVICFVSSTPRRSEPAGVNRDPISFLVVDHQGGAQDEVQSLMGYPLDASKGPSADIDGRQWPLATSDDAVWLQTPSLEPEFVAAMKAGTTLVIKGTSKRGTNTTDTYSLSGITKALDAADAACR